MLCGYWPHRVVARNGQPQAHGHLIVAKRQAIGRDERLEVWHVLDLGRVQVIGQDEDDVGFASRRLGGGGRSGRGRNRCRRPVGAAAVAASVPVGTTVTPAVAAAVTVPVAGGTAVLAGGLTVAGSAKQEISRLKTSAVLRTRSQGFIIITSSMLLILL